MTKIAHTPDYRAKRRELYLKRGLSAEDVLDAILSDISPAALGPNGKAALAARLAVKTAIPKPPTK